MGEYVLPLIFLVAIFVAFGLAHRNHGGRGCHDCDSDGGCDKPVCEADRYQQ